jgi:hypothetical protein
MIDPLRPVSRTEPAVAAVELTRLTPLEREQERQRRERRRQAPRSAPKPRERRGDEPDSGIDVRV